MLRKTLWSAFMAANRLGPEFAAMDRFAALDPREARAHLARRLHAQIQYFGRREDALPEWREAARIADPLELWRHWPELPIVTKEMLRLHYNPREIQQRFGVQGLISSTGGSTGEPTHYLHDRAMLRSTTVRQLYSRMRMGWRPAMPTICVWGSERDIGKNSSVRHRVSAYLRHQWLVDGYNLGPRTVERVTTIIRKFRPVALYGFTSMLEFVARACVGAGLNDGSVATAWNGGEMLYEPQSDIFRRAFGVPILNFYGCRELSALAYQTGAAGPLHVLRPHVFVEIVDRDGNPVGPRESGRLIWTSTVGHGTPFLRYDLGDLGCFHAADGESGIGAVAQLHGRVAGLVELPNGQVVNCIYWNHLLKNYEEVHQFQVAVGKRSIELRLTGDGFSLEREQQLRSVLGRFLNGTPVRINWMRQIPLTPQGKHVQVVKEEFTTE